MIAGNAAGNSCTAVRRGLFHFHSCRRVSITDNVVYNNAAPKDDEKAKIPAILKSDLPEEEWARRLPGYVRSGI